MFFRAVGFQVDEKIRVWKTGGIGVGFDHKLCLPRVHLLGQMNNLRSVSGIFKQDDVVTVQADGPALFRLVEQVLHDVNHRQVAMVGSLGKQFSNLRIFTAFLH